MNNFQLGTTLIILTLLVGACAKPPSQFYDSPSEIISIVDQELFSRAIRHQKKGQIEVAIGLWEELLQKHPNSYEARNNLGLLYYADDQITRAVIQFERGLSLEVGSVKIQKNLSRALKVRVAILGENKEYDKAITDLKRIAKLSALENHEKIERRIESFEDKIFIQVKKSGLREEYEKFLQKYPKSPQNSDEARLWIQDSERGKDRKQKDEFSTLGLTTSREMQDIVGSFKGEAAAEIVGGSVIPKSKPTSVPVDPAEENSILPSQKMVEVIKPNVINVRSEPKIKIDNVVHKLETGSQVIYTDENEWWYQVEFADGQKGWVIKKYTRLLK